MNPKLGWLPTATGTSVFASATSLLSQILEEHLNPSSLTEPKDSSFHLIERLGAGSQAPCSVLALLQTQPLESCSWPAPGQVPGTVSSAPQPLGPPAWHSTFLSPFPLVREP